MKEIMIGFVAGVIFGVVFWLSSSVVAQYYNQDTGQQRFLNLQQQLLHEQQRMNSLLEQQNLGQYLRRSWEPC